MASAKLATLVIRTIAKPISNRIKQQAREHETFRYYCVQLAQRLHRAEVGLRTNILGEPAKAIRPLSEAKAIENGANAIAEGFLFSVAAGLIVGESWRSSRASARRRDVVDDHIEDLKDNIARLEQSVKEVEERCEARWREEHETNMKLAKLLTNVIEAGLKGGTLGDLEGTPLQPPRIAMSPAESSSSSRPDSSTASSSS